MNMMRKTIQILWKTMICLAIIMRKMMIIVIIRMKGEKKS